MAIEPLLTQTNRLQNAPDPLTDPCKFDMLMFGWWRRRQKMA
jgi:hypothetical protein